MIVIQIIAIDHGNQNEERRKQKVEAPEFYPSLPRDPFVSFHQVRFFFFFSATAKDENGRLDGLILLAFCGAWPSRGEESVLDH